MPVPRHIPESPTLTEAFARIPRREGRGFRFVGADRSKHFHDHAALWEEARRRASLLRDRAGVTAGERVALVIPDNREFVLTFFGAVLAGAVPVPIFPRATFRAIEGYVDVLAHITSASDSRVLVCMEQNRNVIDHLEARPGLPLEKVLVVEADLRREHAPETRVHEAQPEDLCFLQFTSGSTSKPKGVMVTHGNVMANTGAFLGPHGLDRTDDDCALAWLPLFHDMGLIGFVLGTLAHDINTVLFPTPTFARTPRLWLELLSAHRATITYAPNFGYQLAVKRVRDRDLETLDLSRMRVAGCGAEPIRARTLQEFGERLAPTGFDRRAFLPSYGMAESTLAITFHPRETEMVVDRIDPEAMRAGHARPTAAGDVDAGTALEVVSCGVPFPGHGLRIVTEAGSEAEERQVGEIHIQGPSVTQGYFRNREATAAAFTDDGWFKTGDLGYLADGTLFVCGRVKDLIILNGANHYPQDLEWAVGELEGVRRGNVVAFSVMRDGIEHLMMAAEGNRSDAGRLKKEIAQRIAETFGIQPAHVAISPLGTLPKTSSGKAQRAKTKRLYEEGDLDEHDET